MRKFQQKTKINLQIRNPKFLIETFQFIFTSKMIKLWLMLKRTNKTHKNHTVMTEFPPKRKSILTICQNHEIDK